MAKHKTNSGFSVVEAVLVIVAVGVIGFTGWFVMKAKHDADTSYANAVKASSRTPTFKKSTTKPKIVTEIPTDPYANWSTYTSKLEGISINYPSAWTITSNGYLMDNAAGGQNEYFAVESSPEKLLTGTLVRANVSISVATKTLGRVDCNGLVVHFIKPINVNGRSMSIVTVDSHTQPGVILGMYVTDEQGLRVGATTTTCQPSFASNKGNENVVVYAAFSRPPQPGDHSDGVSIELTEAEYNKSSTVQQELKALESIAY